MAEREAPANRSDGGGGRWGDGLAVVFAIGVLVKFCGGGKSDQPAAPPVVPPPVVPAPAHPATPRIDAPLTPVARLNVTGTDGTAELQQLAAGITPDEATALGRGVAPTGVDAYAARVRIANTGTVPVRVFPENIAVHYGGESAGATTVPHPRFLPCDVLRPGCVVEGLVLYRARIDIGAALRLAGGGLSYDDGTVAVTYDR